MRNTLASAGFNWMFAFFAVIGGTTANEFFTHTVLASGATSPCAINPIWQYLFTTLNVFILPTVLTILRWKIKDKKTKNAFDNILTNALNDDEKNNRNRSGKRREKE